MDKVSQMAAFKMLKCINNPVFIPGKQKISSSMLYCSESKESGPSKSGSSTSNGTSGVKTVTVSFVKATGAKITAKGKVGDTLYDVVHKNNLDIIGFGACEGTIGCSTCHVILNDKDHLKLYDTATDDELDMLDLVYEPCINSRLGCQVKLTEDMDGFEVKLPAKVVDVRKKE